MMSCHSLLYYLFMGLGGARRWEVLQSSYARASHKVGEDSCGGSWSL